MQYLKGTTVPFFFTLCSPEQRDNNLLKFAVTAFGERHFADALLATEHVCRRFPDKALPAILRARIFDLGCPELAGEAWYRAWFCDPENPVIQDAMLGRWLQSGALSAIRELGPLFLPGRCKAGTEARLVELLRQAKLPLTGACWQTGGQFEGMILFPEAESQNREASLRLSDGFNHFDIKVPLAQGRFRFPCPAPAGVWSIAFAGSGANGAARLLQGSPIVLPETAISVPQPQSQSQPTEQDHAAADAQDNAPADRIVDLIIPVYRGTEQVQMCIDSVLDSLPHNQTRAALIVINDASPEPALTAWLASLAKQGKITLLHNDWNLGFIETVNRGLRQNDEHDVVLLNADTLVHGDWLDRLKAALYSHPDIASVTPWSNNGEISSFPNIATAARTPTMEQLRLIDQSAAALRSEGAIDDVPLPACCGFTMMIRRRVLQQVGVLDGAGLIRGYGEEVDWCMRASLAGYRHLAATGVFVAHAGTVSFGFEKTLRVKQNRAVLTARYPDFHATYQAFLKSDPLGSARQKLAQRLSVACPAWINQAVTRNGTRLRLDSPLSAPLQARTPRIAVSGYRASSPQANKILLLARAIAAQKSPLRLLVIGEESEALWHTGVVDGLLAGSAENLHQLDDATLLGLCGIRLLLREADHDLRPVTLPVQIPCQIIDAHFDPLSWLPTWIAGQADLRPATPPSAPLPMKAHAR